MKELYIRLDGAVGDVVTEFNDFFHLMTSWSGQPKMSAGTLLVRSNQSDRKRGVMRMIRIQPEPYREMKMFDGVEEAFTRFRETEFKVMLYSEDVQRQEKEQWMAVHNIESMIDGFRWTTIDELLQEEVPERHIVTTPFDRPTYRDPPRVFYFAGFDKDHFYDRFPRWTPIVWTWSELRVSV